MNSAAGVRTLSWKRARVRVRKMECHSRSSNGRPGDLTFHFFFFPPFDEGPDSCSSVAISLNSLDSA